MAGIAILWGILKISKRPRIKMAIDTSHFDMFAVQAECKIVPEILPEPVHAIVTIETGIAIGEGVCQGEDRVHLTVAGLAGVRSEGGYIPVMTIIAYERSIRSRGLVTV